MTSTGIPKIGDFGIARVIESTGTLLNISTHGGTGNPHYMSPEQHRGEQADASSDLFMIGINGYLLLTGRHPFAHPSGLFTIPELISDSNFTPDHPKPPASLGSSQQRLFREYSAVVMRLLNRERAGRFASAREAIEALEAVTPFQECPQCGERLPEHFRWCGYCGAKIDTLDTATAHKISVTPPTDFTAEQLVEEGFLLSRSRRWDDAITRYQEAIKLDGTNQKAFHNLGFALNRVGRFDDAEEILTKGIELGIEIPTHKTNFLLERAFARAQLKKYLEALEDINQVIQIFPDSTKALYLRARIHLYRGASLDARSDAQDVLRLIPDHNGALRLLDQLS